MPNLSGKSYVAEFVATVKLATPIMFNQLTHILMQMTDAIMVGHLGAVALAAAGFSGSVLGFFMVFCFGFSSVLAASIAKVIGEKQEGRVGEVFRHGLWVNAVVGLVVVACILVLLQYLDVFRQTPEVTVAARSFLTPLALSVFPLTLYAVYSRLCEAVSKPAVVSYISWGGVALNLVLNWLLIYGHAGFPRLGLRGSALATLTTRVAIFLTILIYVHGNQAFRRYNLQLHFRDFRWAFIRKIFALGLPSGLIHLNEVLAFASGGIMMGWFGTEALAAHYVAINLASATFIIALGWSFASTVRVGEAFGRRDPHEVARVGASSFVAMFLLMTLTAVLFIVFRDRLPFLYTTDVKMAALASQLLVIAAFFQIFDGTQCLGIALNKGILEVKMPLYITAFSYWLLCIPLSYVLAFVADLGPAGIWWGYLISLFVVSVLLNARFFYLVIVRKRSAELARA